MSRSGTRRAFGATIETTKSFLQTPRGARLRDETFLVVNGRPLAARRYVIGIIKELLSERPIRAGLGDPQSKSVGGKKRNSPRSVLPSLSFSLFRFDVVFDGGGRHLMGLSSRVSLNSAAAAMEQSSLLRSGLARRRRRWKERGGERLKWQKVENGTKRSSTGAAATRAMV